MTTDRTICALFCTAAIVLAAMVTLLQMSRPASGCEFALNHSGVVECHVGPYTGPMPVEFMTVDTAKIIEIR